MLVTNRWIISNKKAYRSNKNGVIQTGWYTVSSKKYYGDSNGDKSNRSSDH